MSSIINLTKPVSNPLFGGQPGGLFLRTDNIQYPIFKNLFEAATGKFWTSKMIDFSKDALGFESLPPVAQRMFKLNNGYQSLMDSGVTNLYNNLVSCTTNPELAILYQYIAQNESIHAISYSDGLVQMFGSKASEVIDIVYSDTVVQSRLTSEVDYADRLQADDMESIFRVIVATYLLEHVKFPFSFFVTFNLNKAYGNAINGFSMLIKKIAEDEMDIHYPTNAAVIKTMISEGMVDRDWAYNFISTEANYVLTMELGWNSYLQAEGSVPGYTKAIGQEFINYWYNKALRDVGYDLEPIKPNDTIRWFNDYRNIHNQVVAQQEMRSNAYQKGTIKNDLSRFDQETQCN